MKTHGKSLILGAMLLAGVSQAQTVRINGLVELSGTGFRLEGKGTRIFLTGESRVVLFGKGSATSALGAPQK